MIHDTVITNSQVVSGAGVMRCDIGIKNGLIATLGENISITRFSRFQLGETAPKSETTDQE